MSNELYLEQKPGDSITAENWNELQRRIKADIAKKVGDEIAKLKTIDHAENADKLENQTAKELSDDILKKAAQQAGENLGYQRLYKNLKFNEWKVIKHGLKACPLIDLYKLEGFEVVCSEDGVLSVDSGVLFFLYHTGEAKIRFKDTPGSPVRTITIEDVADPQPFRIAFADLLAYYKVKYTETSSLGDLVNEFEKAFFADPNDNFDDAVMCHSPWFDKCCGDQRTVADLKKRGDWDDLWLKVKPHKTVNKANSAGAALEQAPANLDVVHFNLDAIGIKLTGGADGVPGEMPVMVLLKV